jgi:hypothetical protein
MVDSLEVEDVNLLAQAVHNIEVVGNPVHGH